MPAKSIAQQELFGMALAVRRGEMKKSDVNKEVLDIVNSDMTDKEIEDFASTKHKGLKDHVKVKEGMKSIIDYINEDRRNLGDDVIDAFDTHKYPGKYGYMYYDDTGGTVQVYSMNSWKDLTNDFGEDFEEFAKKLQSLKEGESYSDMDTIYCRIW